MASVISVLGEPQQVNLVVRALKPDYLLLDIFLHLRSETWTQWTIEATVYPRQSNPRRSKRERCTHAYHGLDDFYAAWQASRFRPATA